MSEFKLKEAIAAEVVKAIVENLSDRGGLSSVWESIDEATRGEIVRQWRAIVGAAMPSEVPTYELGVCEHCGMPIAQVRDTFSGVLDWYADGGDYGCAQSPDTDDEGTGSHEPMTRGD